MKRQQETQPECDMCVGNRQLLQQIQTDIAELKATTPANILESLRINVIDWHDGDTLVLTARRYLADAEYQEIAARLEQQFPGCKAMLLEDGMTVGVLRPQDDHDEPPGA